MGRTRGDHISGWLALDKPEGMTSARMVAAIKKIFNADKAGHAGTLDPMASGLLPIALGEATKTASFLTASEKTYRFTLRFGIATDSEDQEGQIIARSNNRPSDDQITAQLGGFIGTIDQTPPIFSAIKKNGRRAYQRARAGETFQLAPRQVQIRDLQLISRPDPDHAVMEMRCHKGVYVRALARDLGQKLGCFAHIAQLRRLEVGPLRENDMIGFDITLDGIVLGDIVLDKAKKIGHSADVPDRQRLNALLLPLEIALEGLPKITISTDQAKRLRYGQSILPILLKQEADEINITSDQPILAVVQTYAVAVCRWKEKQLAPERVFNSYSIGVAAGGPAE